MKKYYQLILALTLHSLPPPVTAEAFNYTYVSVEYEKSSSKIDGFSDALDTSRVSLDLSFAVVPHAAVIAKHSTANADVATAGTAVDAKIKSSSLGLIFHLPTSDTTDFLVGVSFINGKADVDANGSYFGSVDEDGGVSTIGLRTKISDQLELNGFLRKYSIEDTSTMRLYFGAAYYVVESISIELDYSFDSDSDSYALSVTRYF